MPLKVRRFYTSVLLVLFGFITFSQAQQTGVPTSGDVMRERISRAKAFIAVRNYNAAIYELENIRRESNDAALQGGVYVLLMNSYLEQGDYKHAQDLLNEFYAQQKTTKPNASAFYRAVAGQIIKGARDRVERYRALGLSVSDRTLPLEATNDLEKMRETLELVITQSKDIGRDKAKTPDAMALLEEASNSRSMLARDDYDARRWRDEVADSREAIVNSRSVVLDASGSGANSQNVPEYVAVVKTDGGAATNPPVLDPPVSNVPSGENSTREREVKSSETKISESTVAQNTKPVYIPSAPPTVKEESKPVPEQSQPQPEESKPLPVVSDAPLAVGALTQFATSQSKPVYPPMARMQRTTGVVTVEVMVSESGDVTQIQKTSGPMMLQAAAKDAIKKWKFKPFVRDGQPVKATGFVNFNFSL
jgi:periplasmic protein TonB